MITFLYTSSDAIKLTDILKEAEFRVEKIHQRIFSDINIFEVISKNRLKKSIFHKNFIKIGPKCPILGFHNFALYMCYIWG